MDCGFSPYKVNPCVFICNDATTLVYIHDWIVISPKLRIVDAFIKSLKDGPEQLDFTEEGSLDTYLGVLFTDFNNGKQFEMSQSFLIKRILTLIQIEMHTTESQPFPANNSLLHQNMMEKAREHLGIIDWSLGWWIICNKALGQTYQWQCINVHSSAMTPN